MYAHVCSAHVLTCCYHSLVDSLATRSVNHLMKVAVRVVFPHHPTPGMVTPHTSGNPAIPWRELQEGKQARLPKCKTRRMLC